MEIFIAAVAYVNPDTQAIMFQPIVICAGVAYPVGNPNPAGFWEDAVDAVSFANGARRAIVQQAKAFGRTPSEYLISLPDYYPPLLTSWYAEHGHREGEE